jgi:1-acyl-sn-glycerol-3-phosphate acyltransferase
MNHDHHQIEEDAARQSASITPPLPRGSSGWPGRLRLWNLLRIPVRWFCSTWIRVTVSGTEHIDQTRGALLLVNHQSYLDPLLVGVWLDFPVSFLARDSLFRIPLLGMLLRNTGVIPISRSSARSGSIRAAVERLEAGTVVGIFPEGTRSSGTEPQRFRPGFLAVARRTEQPVYPVGICGSDRAMPRGAFWVRPTRIHVSFGRPLSQELREQINSNADDKAICEEIRVLVAELQNEGRKLLS